MQIRPQVKVRPSDLIDGGGYFGGDRYNDCNWSETVGAIKMTAHCGRREYKRGERRDIFMETNVSFE